jgi:D-tyrosyl-tRNA(Tyr) deacylase
VKLLVQRVSSASVTTDNQVVGQIGTGLLVFLGITHTDTRHDGERLIDKLIHLRIFNDESGKMNRSVTDTHGGILVISQFTLYGHCQKGRRPSYKAAAPSDISEPLYQHFLGHLQHTYAYTVESGTFGADMTVALVNDGPVTLILE